MPRPHGQTWLLALALVVGTSGGDARAEERPIQLAPAVRQALAETPPGGMRERDRGDVERALKPVFQPLFDELFAAEGADLRMIVRAKAAYEGGGTEVQALCFAQREAGPSPPVWASVFLRVNERGDAEVTRAYREQREKLERSTEPVARRIGGVTAFGAGSLRGGGFSAYRWFADADHMMVLVKSDVGEDVAARAEALDGLLRRHGLYDLRRRLLGASAPSAPAEAPRLGAVRLYDANPLYLAGPAPAASSSVRDLLARLSEERVGVAADGVSQVVVRVDLAGPGVVALSSSDGDRAFHDGTVEPLFGGRSEEVEERGRKAHVALALYTPPPSFEEPLRRAERGDAADGGRRPLLREVVAWRPARLSVRLGPDASRLEAQPSALEVPLVRPPVLLVHGTFDDPVECWDRSALEPPAQPDVGEVSMTQALRREGHAVFLTDYRETNGGARGRPEDSGFRGNARTLWAAPQGAFDALRTYREGLRVAATQVDVVGHSLGGLIPRLWASQSYNPSGGGAPVFARDATRGYLRPDNFGRGDVHRLVTIATPHQGSDFASLAVALDEMPTPLRTLLDALLWKRNDARAERKWMLERAVMLYLKHAEGYGVAPVVRDQVAFLPTRPNEALASIGPTAVPSHAIVCVAANPDILGFGGLYTWPMRATAWWMLNERPVATGRFFQERGQEHEIARIYGEAQDAGGRRGADAAGGESWVVDEGFSAAPGDDFVRYSIGRAILFGNTQNDMVVRVQSQVGGLPLDCTSLARGVLHSFASRYAVVQDQVVAALGGPAWRFHAPGFPAPGPMSNVDPYVPTQDPARRAEAVEASNVPPSHCEAISATAVGNDTYVLLRPVNRHAEPLVAAHMATKDMHVKGKSASWGPQRGFIPVQQRFSKMWFGEREQIPAFDRKVRSCLDAGRAREQRLVVQVRGVDHEVLVVRGDDLAAPDALVLRPAGASELRGWRNGTDGDFDPSAALPPPALAASEIERRGLDPLFVLADRHSALPLTADFDLLAVAARSPCDAPTSDPEKGFVCAWQVELIRRINEQVRLRANYVGGNVVHHGPETNFPLSEGADYPVTAFEPSGRIATIPQGPRGSHDVHLKAYFHRLRTWGYSVRPNLERWEWGAYEPDRHPATGWRPEDRASLPEAVTSPDDPFDSHDGDRGLVPAGAAGGSGVR